MDIKVLIIDDDREVREFLAEALGEEQFSVSTMESGKSIETALAEWRPDLILLDQILPDVSGTELVKRIRKIPQYNRIPIIMVTGVTAEDDKVQALEMGADDYVCKPFKIRELAARIRAVFRRTRAEYTVKNHLEIGRLMIDFNSYQVTLEGKGVALTLTEFRILAELLKRSGQALSRDELREVALGNLNVSDRTIDVHMASLRKKLEPVADQFQTVRGVGYRFAVG